MKKTNITTIILTVIFSVMAVEITYLSIQNKKLVQYISKTSTRQGKPDLPVGTQLSEISINVLNDKTITLAHEKEKYLFIFFSTNCHACIDDSKVWPELFNLTKKSNINLIGICKADSAMVTEFKKEHNIPFTTIPDPDNNIVRQFGIHSFPSKCLVDEAGKVIFYSRGSKGVYDIKEIKHLLAT